MRTRSSSTRSRSGPGMRGQALPQVVRCGCVGSAGGGRGGGRGQVAQQRGQRRRAAAWARSPARSRRTGTSGGSSRARAASSRARPSAAVSAEHPAAGQPGPVGVAQMAGHGARRRPTAPRPATGRAAPRPGGRWPGRRGRRSRRCSCPCPALPKVAAAAENSTNAPGRSPGELVQVPGGVGLGPHHRVEPRRGQRRDHAVVQDAGGVDHRGQRCRRDPGQQPGQRLAVRGVAGGHPHPRCRGRRAPAASSRPRVRPGLTGWPAQASAARPGRQMPGGQAAQQSRCRR